MACFRTNLDLFAFFSETDFSLSLRDSRSIFMELMFATQSVALLSNVFEEFPTFLLIGTHSRIKTITMKAALTYSTFSPEKNTNWILQNPLAGLGYPPL